MTEGLIIIITRVLVMMHNWWLTSDHLKCLVVPNCCRRFLFASVQLIELEATVNHHFPKKAVLYNSIKSLNQSKRTREIEGVCVNYLQCNALDSHWMIQIQSVVISCIDVFTKICIRMFSLCKENKFARKITVRFMKCAIWAILLLPCSWQ